MWYAPFGSTIARGRAIQLEDQAFQTLRSPADKELVEAAEFEQTLAAALDCRSTTTLVIARTDARAPWDW